MPPLTERFIKYLKSNTSVSPEKWVTKNKLWDLALEHGYRSSTIKAAIKKLGEKVFIGEVWNRDKRVVEYMFYPMTPEEIQKREEDLAWFDNL